MNHQINEALDTTEWLQDQLDGLAIDREHEITCALYSISMQHSSGVLILLNAQRPAPAFALARPVYEAFVRALWYSLKETTTEQKQKALNDEFPGIKDVIKALKKDPLAKNITKMYDEIEILHSYTHGGIQQIKNHLTGNDLGPDFAEAEILVLVSWSVRLAIASAYQICQFANAQSIIDTISKKTSLIYKH